MKTKARQPLTNAQIVERSRAKALAAGARKLGPLLLRDATAIAALDRLVRQTGSQRAAVEFALLNAPKAPRKKVVDIS